MATVTASPRQSKPRTKAPRSIRMVTPPSPANPHFSFAVTEGKVESYYLATPLAADFGSGFQVEKLFTPAAESYAVCLNADGGNHTCECKGFLRWGHKTRCRHVAGLLTLQAAGKLS